MSIISCYCNEYLFFGSRAGITVDTLVINSHNGIIAQNLKTYDKVTSIDLEGIPCEQKIIAIRDSEDYTLDIVTEDGEVLAVSRSQKIFLPQYNEWVCADTLEMGDILLLRSGNEICISSIIKHQEKRLVRHLEVDRYHNFFAGNNGILVHNIFFAIPLVLEFSCLLKIATVAGTLALRAVLPRVVEKVTGKNIRSALQAIENHAAPLYKNYQNIVCHEQHAIPEVCEQGAHECSIDVCHNPHPSIR